MALCSVRSERLFCEQLDYNLLFRWFLDIDKLAASFDPTTFTRIAKACRSTTSPASSSMASSSRVFAAHQAGRATSLSTAC
jgi:hypothetical protein